MYYKSYIFGDAVCEKEVACGKEIVCGKEIACGEEIICGIEDISEGNAVRVKAEDYFEQEKGYGLIPLDQAERRADRFTGSGGWYAGETYKETKEDARPEMIDTASGVTMGKREFPLRFRARVPAKGIYEVTVTLCAGERGCERVDLITNRRNLVRRGLSLLPGEKARVSFYVSVCEYIPVIGEPAQLDDSVYVTVLASHCSVEEKKVSRDTEPVSLCGVTVREAKAPTVFLAGDSLVTDYDGQYPDNPLMNFGSWGQNLLAFLPGAAVCNQAHAGMTTNCFRDDGHFELVMRNIRPGDVFMMQFGHNDQKRRNLKAYVGYAANLRWYIRKIREKGAFPVIVTSLSRIPGEDEDGYFDLLEEYAQSCLRVGKECHVPVIDLHEYSFRTMCRAGTQISKDYFMDVTHTNDYGAMAAANFIAREIKRQGIEPLVSLMEMPQDNENRKAITGETLAGEDADIFAWRPDLSLRPPHAASSAQKEEKPVLPHDLPALPYADCQHIRQEQEMKEAMWKGLLDPCIRYYHPFDEMPRGQFLYLFFKAVPTPKKRSYQGKYCDIYRYEWDASAVQAAEDAGLIDETTTPFERFRPDDALTGGELVSFMVRSLHPLGERNIPMWECEREARGLGLLWEAYGRNRPVNRLDCTVALVHLMNLKK